MARNDRQQVAHHLQHRNREIGEILAVARRQQHRSVTECAEMLATSRRRYNAIERGEAAINAGELEILVRYLEVPADKVWPELLASATPRQIIVQVRPGEPIQFVVEVKENRG